MPSLFLPATRPAVSKRSVDLPIPGSPATKMTDPGTIPPPRTLSNSVNPVGTLVGSSEPTRVMGLASSELGLAGRV